MSLDALIKELDQRCDRWELRRYTQEWGSKHIEALYAVALPCGLENDADGIPRVVLSELDTYAGDPQTALVRALRHLDKETPP